MYGVSGDNWLRINARNGSNFTSGVYFGTSKVRTDGTLEVGSNGSVMSVTTEASTSTPTATFNCITNFNSTNTMHTLDVTDTFWAHDFEFEIQHVVDGIMRIAPTLRFPARFNGETSTTTAMSCSKSGSTLTINITDSSITTSAMAGIVWSSGSRVKVSGKIKGVATETMSGTISNISNGSLSVQVTGGNVDKITATSTLSDFDDITVMVYERKVENNYFPTGILINCYDSTNKSATIKVYGGTSLTPSVTVGNLVGLTFNGAALPSSSPLWGIHTSMGYFEGAVVSTEGQIGGFTIGSDTLKNGDLGATNSVVMSVGTSGTANIAGSGSISGWAFTASNKFGVTKGGDLYAATGKIAGWSIKETYFASGNASAPANNVLLLSPNGTTTPYKVGGLETAINGWTITSGTHFGVTKTGALYADSANITGTITANAGEIGGCSITNGILYVTDANISGQISANHIDASSLSVGQSQVTGLSDALNGKASATDLTALTNKVNAVYGTSSTGKTTGTKVVTCSGFELYNGALITVKFSVQNTTSTVKLNVLLNSLKKISL